MKLNIIAFGFIIVLGTMASISSVAEYTSAEPPRPEMGAHSTYSWIRDNILTPQCVQCHSGPDAASSVDFSDFKNTMNEITAGGPSKSDLFTSVATENNGPGDMPEGCNDDCLSVEQQRAIYWWIKDGATEN